MGGGGVGARARGGGRAAVAGGEGWCGVLVSGLFLFIEIMIVRGATAGATTTNTGGMIAAVAIAPWFPLLGWYFWASFKAA